MKLCLALLYLLFSVTCVLANHESVIPDYQAFSDKYQNLARGRGIIGPPYQETFEYLLVFEPGWLHFVFSHPLDPSQSQEVDEYRLKFHLDWNVCCLEIADQNWTVISMPIKGDAEFLSISFLGQLKQLTFFVYLE